MEYEAKRLRNEPAFEDLLRWLATVDVKKVSTYDYELERRIRSMFADQANLIRGDEAEEHRKAGYEFGWRRGYKEGYACGENHGRSQGIIKRKNRKALPVD